MPIFEYKCEKCNYKFDKMVLRWDTRVECPICLGNVKKMMSMFSVGGSHSEPNNLPTHFEPKMCNNC